MCAIMGYTAADIPLSRLENAFSAAKSRGPDGSRSLALPGGSLLFHRLAIMGLHPEGMQPFRLGGDYLVCNGEIYGFRPLKRQLQEKGYTFHSGSDCEILLPLYREYGVEMFAVLDAADARDAGASLEECARAATDAVAASRFIFAPESLAFLKAGGRIGGASALLGGLLQISPVLTVADWETATLAKVRTWKKTLARMVDVFKEDIGACGLKRVVVHYIGAAAPAVRWAREAVEPVVGHAVEVLPVSPVIGVHVGPAVGLAYECERAVPGKLTAPASELLFSL